MKIITYQSKQNETRFCPPQCIHGHNLHCRHISEVNSGCTCSCSLSDIVTTRKYRTDWNNLLHAYNDDNNINKARQSLLSLVQLLSVQ